MNLPDRNTLGIISCKSRGTPPFLETAYFKQLTLEGSRNGLFVIIFIPMDVDWDRRRVLAWHWQPKRGTWIAGMHPLPSLIYDRCYYTDSRHYNLYKPYVERLAKDAKVHLLGRPLGGKWSTYQLLKPNPLIRPHLPSTVKLQSPHDLEQALDRYRSILIKPNGGSHGRGVIALTPSHTGYHIHGRSSRNQSVKLTLPTRAKAVSWVQKISANTRYIIQPYLSLVTADGHPFDIRILVQKNGSGLWETTGSAVRTGKVGSLTSNIHGGGKAEPTLTFLHQHFSESPTTQILRTIQTLTKEVPRQIEREHGRLVELGLDIGVDRLNRVWLLEVNSKPGRSVFLLTGERKQHRQSILLPVQYARSFFSGTTGGSI